MPGEEITVLSRRFIVVGWEYKDCPNGKVRIIIVRINEHI